MRFLKIKKECPNKYFLCSCSVVSDSLQPHGLQPTRLLCLEFSRQEYRSGWPFPSLGDRPDPGIKPGFPSLQADSLLSVPPGKPNNFISIKINL